jgi:hypothetical protein
MIQLLHFSTCLCFSTPRVNEEGTTAHTSDAEIVRFGAWCNMRSHKALDISRRHVAAEWHGRERGPKQKGNENETSGAKHL